MQQSTFAVPVEGIGTFQFRHRTMRDELRIGAEYSRLTEGVEQPTKWLADMAEWISTLKVLTVDAPEDWNIDDLDPLDPETYKKLIAVWNALRKKENFFRKGTGQGGQASGKGTGSEPGVLVPPDVQPAAQ